MQMVEKFFMLLQQHSKTNFFDKLRSNSAVTSFIIITFSLNEIAYPLKAFHHRRYCSVGQIIKHSGHLPREGDRCHVAKHRVMIAARLQLLLAGCSGGLLPLLVPFGAENLAFASRDRSPV